MAATREDIRNWFERGVVNNATDMVVICDTFDYEDYPCYFNSAEEAKEKVANPGSMQRVMEVYNLKGDMALQVSRRRNWEFSDGGDGRPF